VVYYLIGLLLGILFISDAIRNIYLDRKGRKQLSNLQRIYYYSWLIFGFAIIILAVGDLTFM